MSASTAVIIGEVLVGILQILSARAKAAGLSAEETKKMIDEAIKKFKDKDPNDLPDV